MAKGKNLSTITDLRAHPRNPRSINAEELAGLKVSLGEFGDISGITWNARTGYLVAGHQRLEGLRQRYNGELVLDGSDLVAPDGNRFRIRVVDWPEKKAFAAMVAANSHLISGTWTETLEQIIEEAAGGIDAETFDDLRLAGLIAQASAATLPADYASEHWQEDLTAWKQLTVNFANKADYDEFAKLIRQTLTEKTRSIWFPPAPIGRIANKAYVDARP